MNKIRGIFEKTIFALAVLVTLTFGSYAVLDGTAWIYDNLMLLGIVIIFAFIHKKIGMKPFMYVLGLFSILLHGMGTFGWYAAAPLGIRYDHITHFFIPMTLAIMIYNYLDLNFSGKGGRKFTLFLISVLVVMGIGSFGEVTEFGGAKFFGDGEGIFLWGVGDGAEFGSVNSPTEWTNTSLDMMFNTIGAVFGVLLMFCLECFNKKIAKA